MPTSPVSTWTGDKLAPALRPDLSILIDVKLAPSTTYLKGTVLGEIAATPGTFAPYLSTNSDGTQNPKALLETDCITDSSGNITMSSTAGQVGGEFGQTYTYTQAYMTGYFRTEDLVGLDANAAAKLGFLKRGTIVKGLIALS